MLLPTLAQIRAQQVLLANLQETIYFQRLEALIDRLRMAVAGEGANDEATFASPSAWLTSPAWEECSAVSPT